VATRVACQHEQVQDRCSTHVEATRRRDAVARDPATRAYNALTSETSAATASFASANSITVFGSR
jgi:hypothetical protein